MEKKKVHWFPNKLKLLVSLFSLFICHYVYFSFAEKLSMKSVKVLNNSVTIFFSSLFRAAYIKINK